MLQKKFLTILAMTATLALSGCYRVPIPQGNALTEKKVHEITPGMASNHVVKILGSPVLNNTFDNHQTAYVYTYRKSGNPIVLKRAIIYLENNRVTHVTFDESLNGKPLPQQGDSSMAN